MFRVIGRKLRLFYLKHEAKLFFVVMLALAIMLATNFYLLYRLMQ